MILADSVPTGPAIILFENSPMFLGIEIGGTKLQLGVGPGDCARFEAFERLDVVPADGAEGILNQIREGTRKLSTQFEIERIGIGFGGPIDGINGRVTTSHQIEGWNDFAFVDWCLDELNLPAVLGNDCDCAALAEARFGAGRGHRTVLYVTVGTGVGGGLVIDGCIHGTDRPAAAEVGHLRPGLFADDPHATVESIASGWGIAATARACLLDLPLRSQDRLNPSGRPVLTDVDRSDLLNRCGQDIDSLTARTLGEAAAAGNTSAGSILKTATDALGWAIAQVQAIVAPDVVVIGGGVSLLGDELFLNPVRSAFEQYLFPPLQNACELKNPQLGEEVVVCGAVTLGAQGRR